MEEIKRLLTKEQIEDIWEKALETLGGVGVQCRHKKTLEELGQRGKIEYKDGRIRYHKESLRAHFEKRKARLAAAETGGEGFSMSGHWNARMLCDPVKNFPRPATQAEAVQMARLSDALGSQNVPIPVTPGGINPRHNTLVCERIALMHTAHLGGCLTATDDYEIEALLEMYSAAGRRYLLAVEPLISPLKLNDENMEVYFRYRDRPDLDITVFTIIPMAGATAPLSFPACLIQTLAEALALDYTLSTLSGGRHQNFNPRLDPFDMRRNNIVFGSPEWTLLKQALCELWEGLVGSVPRGGTFRTTSRCVDGQALIQASASFLWQASLGARRFGAVGQMAVDEVWSPVLAMLEGELLAYGGRLMKGFSGCWTHEDPLETIREGVRQNGYFMVDSTLDVLREMYQGEGLSTNENLETWLSGGGRDANQRAWEQAQKRIGAHAFCLPEDAARAVDRLAAHAMEKIG